MTLNGAPAVNIVSARPGLLTSPFHTVIRCCSWDVCVVTTSLCVVIVDIIDVNDVDDDDDD